MSTIEDIRKAFQDVIAPELRGITAKVESLEKRLDERFDAAEKQTDLKLEKITNQMALQHDVLVKTIDAFRAEMRSEFMYLKMNSQLDVARQVAPLTERVAVLEAGAKH